MKAGGETETSGGGSPRGGRLRYDGPVTRPIARVAPLFFVVSTAFLVWPLYPWLGDSIEPRVLGVPWSLVYVLVVIVVNAAVLTGLYMARVIDSGEGPEDGASGPADGAGADVGPGRG